MPYPRVPELTATAGRLYTAAETRELDRLTIAEGMAGFELMKKAARSAYRILRKCWPEAQSLSFFCGGGNNGGDGLVMAALAQEHHQQVEVILIGGDSTIARLQGEAREAYELALSQGVSIKPFQADMDIQADVLVDALLGTGLDAEVRGDFVDAITLINDARAQGQLRGVLAVDIASGLSSDRGRVLGCAVKADVTASFIGLKRGLVTDEGVECSGELYFADLEVADAVYRQVPSDMALITPDWRRRQLPARARTAHKGNCGHVLVVGGDQGMAGAVLMASDAALRAGAGLVSLATRAEHISSANSRCPEVMARAVRSGQELQPLLAQATVILIGPGMGQSAWATQMLQAVYHWHVQQGTPVVWDADALNLLADKTAWRSELGASCIFTPHPGEAARLLGMETTEVQADRFHAAHKLQQQYGGVVVLKGTGTLVTDGQQLRVCGRGNPGMASGGMGDVLAGLSAGLLAQQHLNPTAGAEFSAAMTAACVAVDIHAAAADRCAARRGERGLRATDLLAELGPLVNPTAACVVDL